MRVDVAHGPHVALEVFLDRQVHEAACIQLRIDDEQVPASMQDIADIYIPCLHAVRSGILANGGDKDMRLGQHVITHNPLEGALRNDRSASRLSAN
jgi:hypothetical protein